MDVTSAVPAPLQILYQDEFFIGIDKPEGLLVHRTQRATDREVALTRLRDQIGRRVWPVHRLDRPTSGVLVFALAPEYSAALSGAFSERKVQKTYLAVVRGFCEDEGSIDYAIAEDQDTEKKAALTHYRTLERVALPHAVGKFPEARYSLMEVVPQTGRYHQIRKHFHHISHHLVGDTVYGDGRHNRLFREILAEPGLWLRAVKLGFQHPMTGEHLEINAGLDQRWQRLFQRFGWQTLEWAGLSGS